MQHISNEITLLQFQILSLQLSHYSLQISPGKMGLF